MFEDSYLDSYWESQTEPYYGEDYNLYEEHQLQYDAWEGEYDDDSAEWVEEDEDHLLTEFDL